jgi:hypothetical protein
MKMKGFLDRNFYSIKDQKKIEMEKAKKRYDDYEYEKRQKEAAMWAGIPAKKDTRNNRPMSQNSRASKNSVNSCFSSTSRGFRPTLSQASRGMSEARRDKNVPVYQSLHKEAIHIRNQKN